MSRFFAQTANSPRVAYMQKYNTARANLLLVVVFTGINVLLMSTGSTTYFLFSAFIPYFLTMMGMILCGRLPEEYYGSEYEGFEFYGGSVFTVLLIVSIVLTLLYLLAWYMSRNRRVGWLVFALVFFAIDTLVMFAINGFALESIMDIIFHGWVIFSLIGGIDAHKKIKALPPEPILDPAMAVDDSEGGDNSEQAAEAKTSPVIRAADSAIKHRVLLDATVFNYDICYRRVGRTNELVINGNVYSEYTALAERPHSLSAWIDGHYVEVGLRNSRSFIVFDGQLVSQKIRWI